jgi:hypothetical protein
MKNDHRYPCARAALYVALIAASNAGAVGAKEAPAPNRIMLFDGDTLNGWNLTSPSRIPSR